jgi:hypothetical protein
VRAVLGQQSRRALPDRPGACQDDVSSIFTTAATAVVFDPLESSMRETEYGAKSAS